MARHFFGRGQNTRLGWSDPTLPRKPWRSLQPREQENALFPKRFDLVHNKKGRRNHVDH
jgi:hypothetical protein